MTLMWPFRDELRLPCKSKWIMLFATRFYTLQLGSFLFPNTKKICLRIEAFIPQCTVATPSKSCNAGSDRCRQKCNHTPIYHECKNKYTKYNMNKNLIKMSFAVVWWNPSTFAITLQYTSSVNQIQIYKSIGCKYKSTNAKYKNNNLQVQKHQCKIQTSSKCPLQWFGEIPAHWQPHSTSSSSTTSFTYEDYTYLPPEPQEIINI